MVQRIREILKLAKVGREPFMVSVGVPEVLTHNFVFPRLSDEELRGAMKDCGLGTPATRANIIETILKRGYAVATLLPQGTLIRDATLLETGAAIRVRVARGRMDCEVKVVIGQESVASGLESL